jgi:aldehyde dehydrogenase (NAD+)
MTISADQLAQAYLSKGQLPDLPDLPKLPTGHWIDGVFCHTAGAALESFDPGLGRAFASFSAGTAQEVAQAVEAADAALKDWRHSTPEQRSHLLNRMAALLLEDLETLAFFESLDSGKTLSEARGDVRSAASFFAYYASVARTLEGRALPTDAHHMSWTLREPVGVTAHIIPWNYPTSTFARSVAPALAAGCTVVAKPAETTPFTALLMGQLLAKAGLPAGVVNVVTGLGPVVGAALAQHPKVRHITFTGSVQSGVTVAQSAAPHLASLTLELGGKSPLIALSDCNIETTADAALWAIYSNAGQICSAGSRLVVQRSIHSALLEALVRKTSLLKVGHGLRDLDVGAINSAQQLAKIAGHVDAARARSAAIPVGGRSGADNPADTGWFYRPTILDDLPHTDPCVQEEIFGPVLAVQVVDDDEEALAAANGTAFGLYAGIFTQDISRALRLARDLDAGQVTINDYWAGGVSLPFGGNKQSGYGREKGQEGLAAYLSTKSISVKV